MPTARFNGEQLVGLFPSLPSSPSFDFRDDRGLSLSSTAPVFERVFNQNLNHGGSRSPLRDRERVNLFAKAGR
jgi:hypothetical protein